MKKKTRDTIVRLTNKKEDLKEQRRVLRENWKEVLEALCLDSDAEIYHALTRIKLLWQAMPNDLPLATVRREWESRQVVGDCAGV